MSALNLREIGTRTMGIRAAAFTRSEATYWTPSKRFLAGIGHIRRRGKLPGSFVLDLADLKKAIMLCGSCARKFNSAGSGFVTKKNLPFARGQCDGCWEYGDRRHLFVHHTLASNL